MGDVPQQPSSGSYPIAPQTSSNSSSKHPSPGIADGQHVSNDQYYQQNPSSQQQGGRSPFQNQMQHSRQSASQMRPNELGHGGHGQPGGNFMNMGSLSGALPDAAYTHGYATQQSHSSFQSSPNSASAYQLQHSPQFPGTANHFMPQPQFQGVYGGQQSNQRDLQHPQNMPQQYFQYAQQPQQMPPYYYAQGQFPAQHQYAQVNYAQQSLGRGAFHPAETGISSPQRSNDGLMASHNSGAFVGRSGSIASSSGQSSVPRGPPRKPKQSGHALWVGNLPPTANVVDLKDHFAREATEDILSVFLISKSNCAFVNYKTEESCAAAMTRFHDSRFRDTRLVCRLRRTQVSGVPTGPAALASQNEPPQAAETPAETTAEQTALASEGVSKESSVAKDKYFIVKSLTVEDLDLSVRNGQWATQSHNEETLNKAYEAVDSVYLIFSANKSGEYYGYAKMVSRINEDPAAAIQFAPKAQAVEDPEQPKAIPTPATEFAPKGRIIDDSARGTIFWEAETDDDESKNDADEEQADTSDADSEGSKAWGKPFKIEWLSTNRLPFYRTRGLRNPWNSNREVKIARDGTELETSIGRRLVQMFHREPTPAVLPMPVIPMPQMGYPPMRPPY